MQAIGIYWKPVMAHPGISIATSKRRAREECAGPQHRRQRCHVVDRTAGARSDPASFVFIIPLREGPPPAWPPTCRRYPAAGCEIMECDDARPAGRPAATLSAHPRGRAFARPIGPNPGKTPHLGHGSDIPQESAAASFMRLRTPSAGPIAKKSTCDPGVGTVLPAKRPAAPGEVSSSSYRR
jgi:hypothetical protein